MRDKNSKPVFRSMGIAFDPPEAGTAARARKVIRTYRCNLTGAVKQVTRAVFTSQGRDKDGKPTTVVRTTLDKRIPERPTDSVGFHTKAEKREEAKERFDHWNQKSPVEMLAALDKRLGPGQGAMKQRARLALLIEAAKAPAKKGDGKVNQPHSPSEKMGRAMAHAKAAHETQKPKGKK